MFITVPVDVLLSVYLVRLHLGFSWTELAEAMKKSAIGAVLSALGPILVMAVSGLPAGLSPMATRRP